MKKRRTKISEEFGEMIQSNPEWNLDERFFIQM